MPSVEIPTYRDLMYPTLVAVRQLGGSAAISELEEEVPKLLGLSDDQMAVEYPASSTLQGKSKVVNRLHWARSYLKKIGALDNSERGVWSLTQDGLVYLDMDPQVADGRLKEADNAVRSEMRRAKAERIAAQVDGGDSDDSDDNDDNGDDDWKDTLIRALKAMDPSAFERLSMRLLREAGFRNVEVLGRSGDGGIDGVGVYKPSLVSFPTYFQSKRYAGSVGPSEVRDFRGAMTGRGEKGILITTGTFTPAAQAEATRDGAPPVDLIGGDELCDLLKDYELGVAVEKRIIEDVTVTVEFFNSI
jgi:restriction system protein